MKQKLPVSPRGFKEKEPVIGAVAQFGTVAVAAFLAFLGIYIAVGGDALDGAPTATQPSESASRVGAVRPAKLADFRGEAASPAARHIADWVADSRDNGTLPFVIVDKANGKVFVFSPEGRMAGAAPALLGAALGDDLVPGIGEREMSDILPEERTTPAGRFIAERGRNHNGEEIVWIDYDAAVSLHRVRAANPAERRLQRLASATPTDNRISFGCINVPVEFFDRVVAPAFRATNGVVYVLPETRPVQAVFGSYDVAARVRSAAAPLTLRDRNL